ncbi:uncharacterized protein A1O9_08564 [Exophiala aquamarina CBS 119918]|uniref:Choline/carnitine acyltransferase domain-containing protein n=1 Tax=Exophiala aquamarina CBS 119918 TaxID=1182545 RepID=A0A072P975_9EURO|nr:uncharacterized protein A1O9_08564 [Exophiala aquamarina CBS 119918]KEF55813.1 hypothetical protein A1O9_08564 [Exophiala aquamarina CBS 119918]
MQNPEAVSWDGHSSNNDKRAKGRHIVSGTNGLEAVNLEQLILYSREKDEKLPLFPRPTFESLINDIIEKTPVANRVLDTMDLRRSARVLEPELETKFHMATSQMIDSASHKNWFTSQLRKRYLSFRGPLCEMSQCAVLSAVADSQASATAKFLHKISLTITSLDTIRAIGCDSKGNLYETEQLRCMFATTREPSQSVDVLKTHPKSSHVLVLSNGHMFKVRILDPNSRPISVHMLTTQIQQVIDKSFSSERKNSVATCSTLLGRTEWAKLRSDCKIIDRAAIECIEAAVISVALHTALPSTQEETFSMAKEDTTCVYSDKVFGVSVFPDGTIAARIDHSVADGGLLVLLWQHISSLKIDIADQIPAAYTPVEGPQEIDLAGKLGAISPTFLKKPAFRRHSVVLKVDQNTEYIRFLRQAKLLHIVNLFAYQAALMSILGESDCTIQEPVSTRSFAEGRCDRHYVTTRELLSFCKALDAKTSPEVVATSFMNATQRYRLGLNVVKKGQGFGATVEILQQVLSSMQACNEKSILLAAINAFKKRSALFTGFPFAPAINAVEGFVSAVDRVSCVYIGHDSQIIICLTGTGIFSNTINQIGEAMESNLVAIIQGVVNSNLMHLVLG